MREGKRYLKFCISILAIVSVAILLWNSGPIVAEEVEREHPGAESSSVHPQYVAYYFHGNMRCPTCKKLEQYSQEGINSTQILERTGLNIPLKIVNVQIPENSHFIQDFELYSQSLVITEVKDDRISRWKNLDQIWMLVRDRDKYLQYVIDEICTFVKEG